eukprot:TRINITY_DN1258_c0_g1_i2.p1 TRINITY_DN1258_c0_g1~~TRINITY_DN1258_c0_g1_i2.p1  ORF type:complete len:335 (+),score=85.35 TRINITY_DN1258_c0_g1_i2:44-1048(+)
MDNAQEKDNHSELSKHESNNTIVNRDTIPIETSEEEEEEEEEEEDTSYDESSDSGVEISQRDLFALLHKNNSASLARTITPISVLSSPHLSTAALNEIEEASQTNSGPRLKHTESLTKINCWAKKEKKEKGTNEKKKTKLTDKFKISSDKSKKKKARKSTLEDSINIQLEEISDLLDNPSQKKRWSHPPRPQVELLASNSGNEVTEWLGVMGRSDGQTNLNVIGSEPFAKRKLLANIELFKDDNPSRVRALTSPRTNRRKSIVERADLWEEEQAGTSKVSKLGVCVLMWNWNWKKKNGLLRFDLDKDTDSGRGVTFTEWALLLCRGHHFQFASH